MRTRLPSDTRHKRAFEAVTAACPAARRQAYWPIPELDDAPYFCLRLPTGGDKALLEATARPSPRSPF